MNLDQNEIAHFNALQDHWWNPNGKLRTLHDINAVRVDYIRSHLPQKSFKGLQILDIGCGGGILTEALAKEGGQLTGIDGSAAAINAAIAHAKTQHLTINYQEKLAEDFAQENAGTFDVVTCLEMLEHVPDPQSIVNAASACLKPGGYLFFSTINRTWQAYAGAILAGEYLLNLIPRKTHNYEKFIQPAELSQACRQAQCEVLDLAGLFYNPLTRRAMLNKKLTINYLLTARKLKASS